jgi:hypothetical protein
MAEWELAQKYPEDDLARLHFFSMKKNQPNGVVEFQIVVREYAMLNNNKNESMRFFAEANRQTNQSTAPYSPCGWGSTLYKALADCINAIHRFPYEGPMPDNIPPAS